MYTTHLSHQHPLSVASIPTRVSVTDRTTMRGNNLRITYKHAAPDKYKHSLKYAMYIHTCTLV